MFLANLIIILTLLGAANAEAGGEKPYYFIAVQNGAYNFKGGEAQLAESYTALREMVKLANAQNVKLTLLFSAQYAVYIATDPARLAEFEGWKKTGHETGAYHQGPESRAWDGYSDLAGETLARARKESGASGSPQGHEAYFAALAPLSTEIKTGCMLTKADKQFLAVAPPYEICKPGAQEKTGAGNAGVNEFVTVSGPGRSKKLLSAFHPADKAGIEAAEKAFSGQLSGVYGAVFKSSPSEFGPFYAWLAFLKGLDPQGLRSRTVSAVAEGALLPEKRAAPAPAAKKQEQRPVQPPPELPKTELPRLKPIPSLYGEVGKQMYGPRTPIKKMEQRGRCGDGTCDAFERAHPGRCPRDCGN
ncbi:MAG: hypothetical protein A2X35_00785 [Elusimicrobia bacterium GWA2_61_42]|nr:MAG: hypothetical protein A2X35_00785 [Elusimicrobia bacterium GWA2_61_42]OGR75249.1 MAG: hypothetical protein A2X38_05000 [Elusimicrobia bacterium GWC2_61_25]